MSSSQNVPPESRGLARLFRTRVETAEIAYYAAWAVKIIDPLHERLKRKPTLRKSTAADIERIVRATHNPFVVSSTVEVSKRGHLKITEVMLSTTLDRDDNWDDPEWEKSIGFVKCVITTEGGMKIESNPIVSISAHAVGRWFERSGSRDETKLLHDLKMILEAEHPDHALATHGVWLGAAKSAFTHINKENVKRMPVRMVRTYLHADQINVSTWNPDRVAA
jgi:hypothetical protein